MFGRAPGCGLELNPPPGGLEALAEPECSDVANMLNLKSRHAWEAVASNPEVLNAIVGKGLYAFEVTLSDGPQHYRQEVDAFNRNGTLTTLSDFTRRTFLQAAAASGIAAAAPNGWASLT